MEALKLRGTARKMMEAMATQGRSMIIGMTRNKYLLEY
jgi:hypothetical protein